MACITLTKGYNYKKCFHANTGGIKAIGVAEFETIIESRPNGGILTQIPSNITVINRIVMKNSGVTFSEVLAQDLQNDTNTYTATLTAIISTLNDDVNQLLYELAGGEMFVFIEKMDGTIILMGAQHGATTTGINTTIAGEMSQGQNANITFTSVGSFPHLTLDSTAITAYRGLIQD